MSIDWLRDLVICIFGLVAAGVLIFLAVLAYSLYRRAGPVLDSAKAILSDVQGIVSYAEDKVVKPTIKLVSLIQGIRQGVDTFNKIFRKREATVLKVKRRDQGVED